MSMKTASVRDWIKTAYTDADYYYCGKIDAGKQHVIGVYQRSDYGNMDAAIGKDLHTRTKRINILVHWDKYADTTEDAAQDLYDLLEAQPSATIDGYPIQYWHLMVPEPIDVGTDENGIFERVIWLDIVYDTSNNNN